MILLSLLLMLGAAQAPSQMPTSGYVPQRVYDTDHKRFIDFETMVFELARADVVFVGEQHDDPATHRLELAILEGLLRRHPSVVVAMEMFERDVQPALDAYLAGSMSEDEFLKASRPWPRYATDYRPIVEFAKIHGWRVVAGNVPRRIAAEVASTGMAALEARPPEERSLAAAALQCPLDDYYQRFVGEMTSHPGATTGRPAGEPEQKKLERYFFSQCVKDETMAESVARVVSTVQGGDPPVVVHYNGAFHTDYHDGTAARTKRRLPDKRIVVISAVPVESLDDLKPDKDDRRRADYLVYTLKPVHRPRQ